MRKLIFISLFVCFSISSFSQNYFSSKYWNRLTADTMKVNQWLTFRGDTIWFATYTNARDLKIKNLADPVDLTDAVNLQTLLANATGFDSIDYNLSDNGLLRFLSSSIVIDSVSLDGRHVLLSDSTVVFVTPTQLNDSLANYTTTNNLSDSLDLHVLYTDSTSVYYSQHYLDSALAVAGSQNIFFFTLPVSGSLPVSVGLIPDVPPGWTIVANGTNLEIEHNLNRYEFSTKISNNTSGVSYNKYRSFGEAYSGIMNTDKNNLIIEGVIGEWSLYDLRVQIEFEQ